MILWFERVSLLFSFIKNILQLLILSLRFDFWLSHPIEKKQLPLDTNTPVGGSSHTSVGLHCIYLLFCSP